MRKSNLSEMAYSERSVSFKTCNNKTHILYVGRYKSFKFILTRR